MATLRARAERMLASMSLSAHELSVLITSDRQIRGLNRVHRKQNKATDVLAFPMSEGEVGPLLGDVVISLDTARKQALQKGHPIIHEVTFLLAHGLLHLVGWDHRTVKETRAMDQRTAELVAAAVENH